ncbi:MAG: class I SAM-dependent rRNA methyltransferase [Bacteroidales bacterium]|nr:class I SAM-dependent rRNA methyltransferase [Bacteroidales bacterium]MDY6000687.1 class I SAM-dependent rRNA methyltransferase [Candidatus Cryptobacteroides sp.]
MNMTKIILKKGREESLRRFHPWVFSGAIAQIVGEPAEGDIVGVFAFDGSFLAYGHYQIGSIAVRVLSFNGENPTKPEFFMHMLSKALHLRIAAGLASFGHPDLRNDSHSEQTTHRNPEQATYRNPEQTIHRHPELDSGSNPTKNPVTGSVTNCYRLVHGEGDGLPGLIIDFYDGVCVMQAHSVGMFRAKEAICNALKQIYGDSLKAVYDKSSGTAPFKAGLDLVDGYIYKTDGFSDDEQVVQENGHEFLVNWTEGQKTGFFLDQRENRLLTEKYSKGRNVLNLFCYTGGFSVYALGGGAVHVDSVDSSKKAIDMVSKNMSLNGFENSSHSEFCEDAMEYLAKVPEDKYDLMIVDPPAFAKHRGALSNALRAYQRLNAAAISKVAPGGIIFTFSCSQVVDKEAFALAVFSAAAQTGRSVRILDRLNQPADHAVNIYHPEGEYLKGLLLYVE